MFEAAVADVESGEGLEQELASEGCAVQLAEVQSAIGSHRFDFIDR